MQVDRDWWRTFFEGVVVDFWMAAMDDGRTRDEADFVARALELPAGARVIDVPCGAGRIALALAAQGLPVTAVDISRAFLDRGSRESGPAATGHRLGAAGDARPRRPSAIRRRGLLGRQLRLPR